MLEFATDPLNEMAWTTCSSSFNFTAFHSDFSAFQANPFTVQMPDYRRRAPTALQTVQGVCAVGAPEASSSPGGA